MNDLVEAVGALLLIAFGCAFWGAVGYGIYLVAAPHLPYEVTVTVRQQP